jgi:arsenite methyltransferase
MNLNISAELTDVSKLLCSMFDDHLRNASERQNIVLLGVSTSGMTMQLISLALNAGASIHLNDAELAPERLPEAAPGLTITRCAPNNLKTDPVFIDQQLRQMRCSDVTSWNALRQLVAEQEETAPLIASDSVDVVVIDMLVNRITPAESDQLFAEAFRILRRGGRLLMSLMVADEPLSVHLPLTVGDWRALYFPFELEIVRKLEQQGFHGMQLHNDELLTVATQGEIKMSTFVLDAHKGKQGVCLDQGHAVIFRGPWLEVFDDDGHRYGRGERTAVCAKTYALLMRPPYRDFFIGVVSPDAPPLDEAPLFDCSTPKIRHPRATSNTISGDCNPGTGSTCC